MSIPDPAIKHLVGAAKLSTVRNTYLKGMLRDSVDGWIHPNYNLHLVQTFRSSSDHPNFQNIPKRDKEQRDLVRSVVFPRLGHQFLCSDFSGVEVRIAVCYHKDPNMLRYIKDPTTDMHKDMAVQLFKLDDLDKKNSGDKHLRQAAKNGFVFPQFYGDYYGNNAVILMEYAKTCPALSNGGTILEWMAEQKLVKLNRDGGVVNYDRFIQHVKDVEHDFWYKRFKVYQAWKEEFYARYQRDGYLDLLTGFRCSGVMRKNEVINYPVQGAAFHCLLWSFIELSSKLKDLQYDSRLVGQIHDDMIVDAHPDELNDVAKLMEHITCKRLPEHWDWIIVPIEIETSKSEVDAPWGSTKEFKLKEAA
jgi:DNA polymerase-1